MQYLPVTTTYNYSPEYQEVIQCPLCTFVYTHIGSVTEIKAESEYLDEYSTRGTQLRINMECESGHKFVLIIAHHKGNTYLATKYEAEKPTNHNATKSTNR